jgi:hypothetical protein
MKPDIGKAARKQGDVALQTCVAKHLPKFDGHGAICMQRALVIGSDVDAYPLK